MKTNFRERALLIVLVVLVATQLVSGKTSQDAAATASQTTSFSVGDGPEAVAFDGTNIWAANQFSNTVNRVRVSDGTILRTYSVGKRPVALVFDGANIWVANYLGNTVTKLRASDGVALATLSVGAGPGGLAFDGANIC